MIDLHCHMLPFVDDGPDTMNLALQMAEDAKKQGIDKILLTPHHMDSEYLNHKRDIENKVNEFQKLLYANDISIELKAGQEVHINGKLLQSLDEEDILFTSSNQKYLMLELPHGDVPAYTNDLIFELIVRNITPVIVHPERNHGFQNDPDKLYDLVEQGCITQITASSYVGGFGKTVEKFTEQIIDAGLGFVFSSDSHNVSGRRFRMDDAFIKLANSKGQQYVDEFERNAELIWHGEVLPNVEINKITNSNGMLSIFKKFFN